ncbi:aspartate aminotransferase family protein [Bdellovibrio svalbardensis]|uniref:DegT/DnrJ/EryC1/StrS aminotransferase family protein n=1 Tax=Bdellovibrio svalbardensis TaxID=2972972 RepID=A0ABT6DNE6_9BACT|nr:hypothetical protein [Bdellovibrio svalbardensis]MDG0817351.1 hypothetical protein [Bdellovibrio svalbardensis]
MDILKDEKVDFEFYHIDQNLSFKVGDIDRQKFDIFYLINYFDQTPIKKSQFLDGKILLEDCVFQLNFENRLDAKQWYGFNSYRKITEMADGSLVKTNLEISKDWHAGEAPFVKERYHAKELKSFFVKNGEGSEAAYLELFRKTEEALDRQTQIYDMSQRSRSILIDKMAHLNNDLVARLRNRDALQSFLGEWSLINNVQDPSFFVIKTKNRDELRSYLRKKNIFLPIHWPHFGVDNILYNEIISVPLFSYYSVQDMELVGKLIQEFLNDKI